MELKFDHTKEAFGEAVGLGQKELMEMMQNKVHIRVFISSIMEGRPYDKKFLRAIAICVTAQLPMELTLRSKAISDSSPDYDELFSNIIADIVTPECLHSELTEMVENNIIKIYNTILHETEGDAKRIALLIFLTAIFMFTPAAKEALEFMVEYNKED